MTKHLKLAVAIGFIMTVTGAYISLGHCEENLTVDEFKAMIETKFSDVTKYEIEYMGEMNIPSSDVQGGISEKFWDEQIANLKDVIQRRKEGRLSPKEAESWKDSTDQRIEMDIQKFEGFKTGMQFDSFYVFSQDGNKQRTDIFRTNDTTRHHYYLFDGQNGFIIFPEKNKIESSPSLTKRWENPSNCNGYGFNFYHFIDRGFAVQSIQDDKVIVNSIYTNENQFFEFEFLDDNPLYWKKVTQKEQSGSTLMSVECDQFQEVNGILVPKTILISIKGKNDLYPFISLTLVKANIGDATFPEGFFDRPAGEKYIVKNYNR